MTFQFVHVNLYALKPSVLKRLKQKWKRRFIKWSVSQILKEAARVRANSRHVLAAEIPRGVVGLHPLQIEARINDLIEHRRSMSKGSGRNAPRIRQDQPILITEIFSFPDPVELVRSACEAGKRAIKTLRNWATAVIKFLRKKCLADGREFLGAVLHMDESHPHLHCFSINTSDPTLKAYLWHPGEVAKQNWYNEHPRDTKGADAAYVAAMQAYQDEYQLEVAKQFGQARSGPLRPRVPQDKWKSRRATPILLDSALPKPAPAANAQPTKVAANFALPNSEADSVSTSEPPSRLSRLNLEESKQSADLAIHSHL